MRRHIRIVIVGKIQFDVRQIQRWQFLTNNVMSRHMKKLNLLLLCIIFSVFALYIIFSVCFRTGDNAVNSVGKFKIGDCFTVVTGICVIDGDFRTEDGTNLESLKQWATNFNKTVVYVPVGTTFKLESLIKHTRSSWNTGFYTYYTIKLMGLDKEFKGQRYDASALSYQRETRFSDEWKFGDIPERTSEWPAVEHHPQRIIFKKITKDSSPLLENGN